MTDADELQRAVDHAEAQVAELEREVEALTERRRALTQAERAALRARKAELTESLRLAQEAQAEVAQTRARLQAELHRPRFPWSALVAPWLTWMFRSFAFTIYVSSVIAAHRRLQSPGLVLGLVLGLPVVFVLLSVAASLRESRAAEQTGVGAGQGTGAARSPAIDEGALTPPGGSGDHRAADLGGDRTRSGAGDGP